MSGVAQSDELVSGHCLSDWLACETVLSRVTSLTVRCSVDKRHISIRRWWRTKIEIKEQGVLDFCHVDRNTTLSESCSVMSGCMNKQRNAS